MVFIENPISKVTEEIICTPSHRIYIEEKGWMKASEILVNDEVLLYNSNIGIIKKIELEKLEHPEVTYNFEVEDYYNYFVSEESVLVHNDCNPNIENSNPLEDLKYTDKVRNDKLKGDNHSFSDIVDNYGSYGKQSTIIGGDGKVYNQVEIEGSYNGSLGVFEYKYD